MDDCIFNPLPSAVILSVFVKQLLFFCIARDIGVTHAEFSSQMASIRVAYCDAILLSVNTGMRSGIPACHAIVYIIVICFKLCWTYSCEMVLHSGLCELLLKQPILNRSVLNRPIFYWIKLAENWIVSSPVICVFLCYVNGARPWKHCDVTSLYVSHRSMSKCWCVCRSERRLWLCVLFSVCAVVYAARAVMPLCIVAVSREYHWSKTEMVTVRFIFSLCEMDQTL